MTAGQLTQTTTSGEGAGSLIVNDFSLMVATVNGSGSQTANTVLLRALFAMGIPVSAKNLFPSNIAGLPTWFSIRASREGWTARKAETDWLVAMNPDSAADDLAALAPGKAVIYDEPLRLDQRRSDLHFYKVLGAAELDRLGGFARYRDADGDGVGYRTLPGTPHPAAGYFTRGSGHNEQAQYSERPEDFINNLDRLTRKFESLRSRMPSPEMETLPHAEVGLICCGSSHPAAQEARCRLAAGGLPTGYLRLKAFPFTAEVREFVEAHRRLYVIEQNRDAQLLSLLAWELPGGLSARLRSVRYYGGWPLEADGVFAEIARREGA